MKLFLFGIFFFLFTGCQGLREEQSQTELIPVFDNTSEESFLTSLKMMKETMSKEDFSTLGEAFLVLALAYGEDAKNMIHGKNSQETIELAYKIPEEKLREVWEKLNEPVEVSLPSGRHAVKPVNVDDKTHSTQSDPIDNSK